MPSQDCKEILNLLMDENKTLGLWLMEEIRDAEENETETEAPQESEIAVSADEDDMKHFWAVKLSS